MPGLANIEANACSRGKQAEEWSLLPHIPSSTISGMGTPTGGPICGQNQCSGPGILLSQSNRPLRLGQGCISPRVELPTSVCVFTPSTHVADAGQSHRSPELNDSHYTALAGGIMVGRSDLHGKRPIDSPPELALRQQSTRETKNLQLVAWRL